ncbi:PREDICTED: putative disease resistance protein At3g15700 [Nelumbo nucifera]|uniref:Disease resistance protein At3g15700 n=1 Tax=Nelumbo nucifera TaxID=4432 RepID=A0A1U8A1K7_NELNU|nr:PREDICTED: putative disease resistance protein At3g15700 [Nelumbo nucifera]
MLKDVVGLKDRGYNFSEVAYVLDLPKGEGLKCDKAVGLDMIFGMICDCIRENDEAGIIGLYGTRGVGKTTILRKINNEFQHNDFDVVVWVTVSKAVNEERIHKEVGDVMGLTQKENANQVARAADIHKIFIGKKFLLLFNDIWKKVELVRIGILDPIGSTDRSSKVIFTTRSERVCRLMKAKKKIQS